jgi:hypothetical protein
MVVQDRIGEHNIAIDLHQQTDGRTAEGTLRIDGVAYRPGFLQATSTWASVTGSDGARVVSITYDPVPPRGPRPAVVLAIDGKIIQ